LASFDDELRRTLEHLLERGDEVTILLVVLETPLEAKGDERDRPTRSGAFVISSSRGLPAGEIEGARWSDLAPTLLKLAGKPIPDGLAGMPLELEGMVPRVEEDEQAVLERLRGLGYLS
jgi:arylsulfatase A-like enzyme